MLVLLLAQAVQVTAQAPADTLVARAHTLTAAEQRCRTDPNSTDVTVCGLRGADRFRVPLLVRNPSDRRNETVAAERARLLYRPSPLEALSPFQVGGGMAGVSVTVGGGADGVRTEGWRPLAP